MKPHLHFSSLVKSTLKEGVDFLYSVHSHLPYFWVVVLKKERGKGGIGRLS